MRAGLRLLVVAALALILPACGPLTFVVGVTPGDMRLTSTVVESDGEWGSDRIAVIDVTGVIVNARTPALLEEGENPVSLLREQLVEAGNDPRVKAVVLRLNTPGGGVTASDIMFREVEHFREATGKPVVAMMMDVAASGGYYLACATDYVVAYPTTITGSIGVILQTISFKRGLDRIGVDTPALVSGPNKDAGSMFSTLTPEQRATLQELVDDYYARFVETVRLARPEIPAEKFAMVTDGRVFSGVDAEALGLVDQTGDLRDAVAAAKRLAGIDTADLVMYHRPLDYVATPYSTAAPPTKAGATSGGGEVNLIQLNVSGLSELNLPVGAYYLWRPDLN